MLCGRYSRNKTLKMITLKCDSSSPFSAENMLKKSVISDGFEKLHAVPRNNVSDRRLRKERQKEREKTKGSDWYNMPATKITEEVHRDLEVLQMRSAMDPKRFYKKNDLKALPKYFQIGRVVDSPADFYSSRVPKKGRKRTLVDELMADAEFKQFTKRKYQEIIRSDPKRKKKALQHARRIKKLKRK